MIFDNEVTECLVVRFNFSVIRLELLVLIGGFHEFPVCLSWTVPELAFLPKLGNRGCVSEV